MNRFLYTLIILCCIGSTLFAQTVPQGMKYQAVARDITGELLPNQTISIKINLLDGNATGTNLYSEVHRKTTNELGLFDLVIGQGKVQSGTFEEIAWDKSEIWMSIELDEDGEDNFTPIGASQLLAVPYAFHAGTAGEIDDESLQKSSAFWKTNGNIGADPLFAFLGTVDFKDLVFRTNYIERLRILKDGDVNIINSVSVGQNAYLNTNGGQTINNGPFTVANESPTVLSGNVDMNTIGGETNNFGDFTAKQNVDLNTDGGETNNNGRFRVLNGSNTELSGTLDVDEATRLKKSLLVYGPTNLQGAFNVNEQSPSTLSGTLQVQQDATFDKDVSVGEEFTVEGPSFNPDDPNTPLNKPKLKVEFEKAEFGVPIEFGNKASFKAPVTIANDDTPIGETALIVKADVARGTTGAMPFVNPENTPENHVAQFENLQSGNGISIKVGSNQPHNWNNFITFYAADGTTVGRIEGEDSDCDAECQALLAQAANQDLASFLSTYGLSGLFEYIDGLSIDADFFDNSKDFSRNREYMNDVTFAALDVAQGTLGEIFAIANTITAATEGVSVASDARPCVGLGACVTSPGIGRIIVKVANVLSTAADLVTATLGLAQDVAAFRVLKDTQKALEGITFASGAEDYAEYLPKLDPSVDFLPGEVVGMKNGFITRNTKNATRVMVISHNPAMLGGLPQDEDKSKYEMVAFLGQIPTFVMGKVEPGDYILPSGWNNGYGIARNPKDMKPEDYKKILGVAWEGVERGMNQINVAVGLNTNDVSDLLVRQAEEIKALQSQMTILADLVPGFKEAAGITTNPPAVITATDQINTTDAHDHDHDGHDHEAIAETEGDMDFEQIQYQQEIVYFEITEEHLNEGLQLAMENAERAGVNLEKHPFWSRITTEQDYKTEVFESVKKELKHSFHTHKKINDKFYNKN